MNRWDEMYVHHETQRREQKDRASYKLTMRRCPECAYKMVTDGGGRFYCNRCGYEDRQDVAPLREAGLGYGSYVREWNRKAFNIGVNDK